jgi:cation transport ATPase
MMKIASTHGNPKKKAFIEPLVEMADEEEQQDCRNSKTGKTNAENEQAKNMDDEVVMSSLLLLALTLVGYSLLQYFLFTWSVTNLFVGFLAVAMCILLGRSIQDVLHPILGEAFIVSAVYCFAVAAILFISRIRES